MTVSIFWFRQDLRLHNNPALTMACHNHSKIIPIYIQDLSIGSAQKWWLHYSLIELQNSLNNVGLQLCLRRESPLSCLKTLIEQHNVSAVYWNRCYEPNSIARDKMIKMELKQLGVNVISCNGSLLNEPWEILNNSGDYFKVFTPYWKKSLQKIQIEKPYEIKTWPSAQIVNSESLDTWNLLPKNPDWASNFSKYWTPGEKSALENLNNFIVNNLYKYKDLRNDPAKSATSKLSPYLHFGEISPKTIWNAVQEAITTQDCDVASLNTYLSEIGWREFSYQLLYHYPSLIKENFKTHFNNFPWSNNSKLLKCWQHGLTGYPIIDAGMRELWNTGYMHNRVRMIVASFLTKDLLIDWRDGAAWFLDTLLDADLASNSASWQWVAGSGADAAPYYRIFNPVLQGEKFDPKGIYVRRWVPELSNVPDKWIHKPWEAPIGELLGLSYPKPIVKHDVARKEALIHYQNIKKTID